MNDNKDPRNVYAFIDSQNLNLGVKSSGWELDFGKFRTYLKDKYHVEKAFLFIGYVSGNEDLYKILQDGGYILIFKPVIVSTKGEHPIKGNVDAEMVLHAAAIEFDKYEHAIIVTGDGDFSCLVKFLIEKKKLLKLIVPNAAHSSLLKKFSKHILNVKLIKNKVKKS